MEKLPVPIGELFRGKSVLVTGFTGFLGKALVEKLLYSCSDLAKIYILVRPKMGKTVQERLQEIFSSDVFYRLKAERPGLLESKVQPIEGDITRPLAGLSEQEADLLAAQISIFYHMAADVRFLHPLPQAVLANTRSTKHMIELALRMPKLQSFVYVSTAFTNSNRKNIKEEVYPPHSNWRKTIEICEKVDSETMAILTKKYTERLPNTYVYSKQLAESIIKEYDDQLPMSIIRPSVVMTSMSEPIPGWFDTVYGIIGVIIGSTSGVIKSTLCRIDNRTDLVPVDYVARTTIIASALRIFAQKKDTLVYNCCTKNFGVTHRQFIEYCLQPGIIKQMRKRNLQCLKPNNYFVSNFWFTVDFLYRSMLPALIVDSILKLAGREPMLVKLRRKVYWITFHMQFFGMNEFNFECNNIFSMADLLHPDDRQAFYCEFSKHDNKNIFLRSFSYIIKYLDENIITSKTVLWAMLGLKYIDLLCQVSTYVAVSYLLYWSRIPQNIISLFLNPSL